MTIANLGRQHQKSLNFYFKIFNIFVFAWNYKLKFHTIYIAWTCCIYFQAHIAYVIVIPRYCDNFMTFVILTRKRHTNKMTIFVMHLSMRSAQIIMATRGTAE